MNGLRVSDKKHIDEVIYTVGVCHLSSNTAVAVGAGCFGNDVLPYFVLRLMI